MTQILHIIDAPADSGTVKAIAEEARAMALLHLRRHRIVSLDPSPGVPSDADAVEWLGGCSADQVLEEVAAADLVHVHYWNTPALNALLRRGWPTCRLMVSVYAAGTEPPHVVTRPLTAFADVLLLRAGTALPEPLRAWPADRRPARCAAVPVIAPAAAGPAAAGRGAGLTVVHAEAAALVDCHRRFVQVARDMAAPGVSFLIAAGSGAERLRQDLDGAGAVEVAAIGPDEGLRRADVIVSFGEESARSWNSALLRAAAAAGVPAILAFAPACTAGVIDNVTGFATDSVPDLRAALAYLADPGVRAGLGARAQAAAARGFGERAAVEDLEAAYRRLIKLPRRSRQWGQDDAAAAPAREFGAAELLPAPHGGGAALEFVRSLGAAGAPFAVSLLSSRADEVEPADADIQGAGALRGGELEAVLGAYATAHPRDPYLQYWLGLLLAGRGALEPALAAFGAAERMGMVHWRLAWRQSVLAFQLHRYDEARRRIARVLWFKPDHAQARELRQALLRAGVDAA
ncbi:hypothetical protein [Azospirillum sp.]|uniref:hypothetical protein n=1 Tax=Azospirillum sp. TaxID=34012 RepID=UPI002D2D701E|nr:hypothetical protein [Azospirillum sp.]HYD63871.1 hypothetical protein [Azospirillum sp.]